MHGLSVIKVSDRFPQTVSDSLGRPGSAQRQGHVRWRRLRQRYKRLQARIWFSEASGKTEIINHSNNLLPLVLRHLPVDSFADRIFVWPKPAGHRLIDDKDRRSIRRVGSREIATLQQMTSERFEVVCANWF